MTDVKDAEIDLPFFRFVPRRAFFFLFHYWTEGHCCTLFGSSSGKQTLAVSPAPFYLFDWLLHRQDLAGRDCHFKSDMFLTKYPADFVQPAQFLFVFLFWPLFHFVPTEEARSRAEQLSADMFIDFDRGEASCWRVSAVSAVFCRSA